MTNDVKKRKQKNRIKHKVICQTMYMLLKHQIQLVKQYKKTPKSTNVKCLLNVFEKSPVTPPEELHQRENCSKKQKK